jgi:parallel beta-helix repeat protein
MRSGLLAALVLVSGSAYALDERCVDTVAELNAAWQAAADDDVLIKLVQGTYNLSGSCLDSLSYCAIDGSEITIRGGYSSTCATNTGDPEDTVLTNGFIRFGKPQDPLFADLTLDNLAIRSAGSVEVLLEDSFSPNYSFEMTRVWLDQSPMQVSRVDRVYMDSNLITRAGATFNEALTLFNVDRFTLINNTIADNVRSGLLVPNGDGLIANNIFYGNAGPWDWRVIGEDAFDSIDVAVVRNLYELSRSDVLGIWQYVPSGNFNSATVNPLFINPAALNYQLGTTSALINKGIANGQPGAGADHDGGPRWTGESPDLGAYETNIGSTATTLTVTSTSNSGPGTLRQAIIDANAGPNVNRIEFAIGTTCGPRVINLTTPLPDITGPVVIDGYTQPGAARNTQAIGSNATRCIILNGGGTTISAIVVQSGSGGQVTIDGLAFGGFSISALNLFGGDGHTIHGSQFGGTVGAVTLLPNVNGLTLGNVTNAQIGVRSGRPDNTPLRAGARNVFADSLDRGILVGPAAVGTEIFDNYIGIGPNGSNTVAGNLDGIVIQGLNTLVQGATISNNRRHGVRISGAGASGTTISANRIGVPLICVLDCSGYGNDEDGVRIEGESARSEIRENLIAYNGGDGIVVTASRFNYLVGNSIYENAEQPIDLGDDGTSANGNNSVAPPGGAGNDAQNRPLLTSAQGSATDGIATGSLTSRNGRYRILFYGGDVCGPVFPPPARSGEPRESLGGGTVTITNGTATTDGVVTFSLPVRTTPPSAYFTSARRIMATATRLNVFGPAQVETPLGTSELSSCVTYDALLFSDGFEAN